MQYRSNCSITDFNAPTVKKYWFVSSSHRQKTLPPSHQSLVYTYAYADVHTEAQTNVHPDVYTDVRGHVCTHACLDRTAYLDVAVVMQARALAQ